MGNKLYGYLEGFMIQNNWIDEHIPEQARLIFTTICLTENIDADTQECDNILSALYWRAALEELTGYGEFTNFMLELII